MRVTAKSGSPASAFIRGAIFMKLGRGPATIASLIGVMELFTRLVVRPCHCKWRRATLLCFCFCAPHGGQLQATSHPARLPVPSQPGDGGAAAVSLQEVPGTDGIPLSCSDRVGT